MAPHHWKWSVVACSRWPAFSGAADFGARHQTTWGLFGGIDALLIGDFAKFAHAEYELDGRDAPHRERRSMASQALPARVMRLFVVRRAITMAAVKPGKRTSSATRTKRRTYASERA